VVASIQRSRLRVFTDLVGDEDGTGIEDFR
jgi:hypothetical protein